MKAGVEAVKASQSDLGIVVDTVSLFCSRSKQHVTKVLRILKRSTLKSVAEESIVTSSP